MARGKTMVIEHINVIISVWILAFALSMDAFSVSLSIGMQEIRLKKIAFIGLIIGLFHIVLPLIGMVLGHYISEHVAFITELTGGFILVIIGSHMFIAALQNKSRGVSIRGWKIWMVALFVSVDSFPAGLSIGFMAINPLLILMTFGVCSILLSWVGMVIGRKVHTKTGKYSEMLGGIILYLIGLSLIF